MSEPEDKMKTKTVPAPKEKTTKIAADLLWSQVRSYLNTEAQERSILLWMSWAKLNLEDRVGIFISFHR